MEGRFNISFTHDYVNASEDRYLQYVKVQTMRKIAQIFFAFSEKLNFNEVRKTRNEHQFVVLNLEPISYFLVFFVLETKIWIL